MKIWKGELFRNRLHATFLSRLGLIRGCMYSDRLNLGFSSKKTGSSILLIIFSSCRSQLDDCTVTRAFIFFVTITCCECVLDDVRHVSKLFSCQYSLFDSRILTYIFYSTICVAYCPIFRVFISPLPIPTLESCFPLCCFVLPNKLS